MKKLLGAALALALGVTCTASLAGCNSCGSDGGNDNNDAAIAERAINQIHASYDSLNNTESKLSYKVNGKVKVDTEIYNVDWTASVESVSANDISSYVSIGELEGSQRTVTVTRHEEDYDYTLTAAVTVGKVTEKADFKMTVKKSSGSVQGETKTVTLEFDSAKNNRTEFEAGKIQVWQNDKNNPTIIVTNTGNVGDYYGRFYKSTPVKIECDGMKYITLDCPGDSNDKDYTTPVKTSIENAGIPAVVTVSDDHKTVTIELSVPVNSIEFTCSDQIRINSMEIIALVDGPSAADKVALAKATLSITTSFVQLGTLTLPSESNGATISWKVKETTDLVSITGNTLSIDKLPATDTPLNLVAEIGCDGVKDTKEIEITVYADLGLKHAGTETDPYSPTDANKVGSHLAEDAWTDSVVYVQGYVIATGSWSGGTYNNYTGVYLGDTATTAKDDAFQVYRLVADGKLIDTTGTSLKVGQLITVKGYIQNYKGNTPEMAEHNGLKVYAVAMGADERTDDQKAEAALDALTLTTVTSNINLTSSVTGVTLSITNSTNTAVIATNGTVTRPEAGEEDASVTITVQASIGEATKTKDFTVTVPAETAVVAGESVLQLTKEKASEWGSGTSYAAYDGDHDVGNYTVTTANIMANTYNGYDVLQFRAKSTDTNKPEGVMTVDGEFTKIVIVFASTYNFDKSNPVTIKAGDATLTCTLTNTEDTGVMVTSGSNQYELHLYTVEFVVTGTGSQTITITKDSTGAGYITSINFFA